MITINEKSILQEQGRDAITPVYPLETLLGGGIAAKTGKIAHDVISKMLRNPEWVFGKHKSKTKWENRMKKRGWTEEKITETIKKGKTFPAPNDVNKNNSATRYEFNSNFVVRDDITKEIIQLGERNFVRRIK